MYRIIAIDNIIILTTLILLIVSTSYAVDIVSLPIAQVRAFTTYINESYYIIPQPNPQNPPTSFRVGFYLQYKSNNSDVQCSAYVGNGYLPSSERYYSEYVGLNVRQEIWATLPYYSTTSNPASQLPLWIISVVSQGSNLTYENSRCSMSVYVFGYCHMSCSGVGMCDAREGRCKCDDGFYGLACENAVNVSVTKHGLPLWAIGAAVPIAFVIASIVFFFIGKHYGYRDAYTLK